MDYEQDDRRAAGADVPGQPEGHEGRGTPLAPRPDEIASAPAGSSLDDPLAPEAMDWPPLPPALGMGPGLFDEEFGAPNLATAFLAQLDAIDDARFVTPPPPIEPPAIVAAPVEVAAVEAPPVEVAPPPVEALPVEAATVEAAPSDPIELERVPVAGLLTMGERAIPEETRELLAALESIDTSEPFKETVDEPEPIEASATEELATLEESALLDELEALDTPESIAALEQLAAADAVDEADEIEQLEAIAALDAFEPAPEPEPEPFEEIEVAGVETVAVDSVADTVADLDPDLDADIEIDVDAEIAARADMDAAPLDSIAALDTIEAAAITEIEPEVEVEVEAEAEAVAPYPEPDPEPEVLEDLQEFVVFSLGDWRCVVPIRNVIEVGRIPEAAPVPNAPVWMHGLGNLRGQVLSLIDLRAFFGVGRIKPSTGRMVVLRADGDEVTAGVMVDQVHQIVALSPSRFREAPATLPERSAHYVWGACDYGNFTMMGLDVDGVLGVEALADSQPV